MSYGINPQDPESSAPSDGSTAPSDANAPGGSESASAASAPVYGNNPYSQGSYGQQSGGYPAGSQPGESVNFMGAVKNFFRKWKQFTGRASRSEFWWAYLAQMLITAILLIPFFVAVVAVISSTDPYTGQASGGAVAFMLFVLALIGLVSLALIVPNIALTVRRLHDTNKSGWFYFVSFIPGVGGLVLLVLCALEPDPAGAAFDA